MVIALVTNAGGMEGQVVQLLERTVSGSCAQMLLTAGSESPANGDWSGIVVTSWGTTRMENEAVFPLIDLSVEK